MKNRLAVLACIFVLGCMSFGCGATAGPSGGIGPTDPANVPSGQLEITTTQLPDATSNASYTALLAATGGDKPYVWSVSGALPPGLTMSSRGVISGRPQATGESMISVRVKDSEENPQSSEATLALDVTTGGGPSSSRYFGPGINMISLSNFAMNSAAEYVDYTFLARQTGSIETMMPYFVDCKVKSDNPCATGAALYGSGIGAEVEIEIYPDNGFGRPDMAAHPLGSIAPFWVCGGGQITSLCRQASYAFRKLQFEQAISVVAGTEYHIVFRNIAKDPTANFSSLDASLSPFSLSCPNVNSPAQPTFAPSELGVLRSSDGGSTWGPGAGNACNTPIVDIGYSNGFHQGNGYTYIGDFSATIGGSADLVRELFTVGGSDKAISAVSVFVNHASGSEGLYAALEDSSGNILAKGQAMPDPPPFSFWRTYKFSSPVTLRSGRTYQLILTATSSYSAGALENGSQNGEPFSPDTVWSATNPAAQFSTDGGRSWTSWEQGPGSNESADLMFYFTLQ